MTPARAGRAGRAGRLLPPAAAGAAALGLGLAIRHGPASGPVSFVLGWVWGLLVLASLVGWGRGCNLLLLPGAHRGWGMRAAWGLALTVAVGGLLNLLSLISPGVVLAYLAAGAGLLAWRPSARRSRSWREAVRDPAVLVLFAVVAGLGAIQYSSSVAGTVDTVYTRPAFDLHDDLQAYLVFPRRMLETGSLGREPFEPRRALSLGGQSFLDALVLAARPVRALHLVDEGVALLILLGLVAGAGRRCELGPRLTGLVMLLALWLPHLQMRANTSALLTGVALLLAWFFEELEGEGPVERGAGRWVLAGLVAAAACAVKSTFIPFVVVFYLLTLAAGVAGREGRGRVLAGAAMTGAVAVAALAPWMIALDLSSGTFLYPVLGRGFLGAASNHGFPAVRGDFGVPAVAVARMIWRRLLPLLPALLLLVFVEDRRPRRPAIALGLAAALAVPVIVLAGDPNLNHSLMRYVFPLVAAALVGLAVAALEGAGDRPDRLRTVAAVAVIVALLVTGRGRAGAMVDQMLVNIGRGVAGRPLVPDADREAVRRLQEALPGGATVLATLRYPFLLDQRRNRVFIMSLPGFSSPPPGLPIDDGAGAVASYLVGHGVRFLAYGGMRRLGDLLALTEKDIRSRYPRSRMRWAMLVYHRLYRREVLELASTRRVLYRDDRRVLVDLATRETTVFPSAVAGRRGFYRDYNWTDGDGVLKGLDLPVPPGARELDVVLFPAHPRASDPGSLGVRVLVDGKALEPLGAAPLRLRFALPRNLRRLHRIEIRSDTFVPARAGIGADTRRLGIPVAKIVVPAPGG